MATVLQQVAGYNYSVQEPVKQKRKIEVVHSSLVKPVSTPIHQRDDAVQSDAVVDPSVPYVDLLDDVIPFESKKAKLISDEDLLLEDFIPVTVQPVTVSPTPRKDSIESMFDYVPEFPESSCINASQEFGIERSTVTTRRMEEMNRKTRSVLTRNLMSRSNSS
jgi:hypothetical protein